MTHDTLVHNTLTYSHVTPLPEPLLPPYSGETDACVYVHELYRSEVGVKYDHLHHE